jgi:hypothetical protein
MKAPQHIPLTTERREHHSDQRALRDRLELRLEQLWGDSLNATPDGHNHHPVVDRSMRLQKHKRENNADGTDPPTTQDEQQQRLSTTVSLKMLAPILAAFGCLEGTVMQEWVKQLGELRQGDIPKEEYLSFDTGPPTRPADGVRCSRRSLRSDHHGCAHLLARHTSDRGWKAPIV